MVVWTVGEAEDLAEVDESSCAVVDVFTSAVRSFSRMTVPLAGPPVCSAFPFPHVLPTPGATRVGRKNAFEAQACQGTG